MKTIHKLLVLSVLAIISFMFSSVSATTADPLLSATQSSVNPSPIALQSGRVCSNDESTYAKGDLYLPLNRWGDVGSFHTRLSTGAMGVGNLAERIQKQGVATMFLSAGNIAWKGTAMFTVMADRFCIGENLFIEVDGYAAAIGESMLSNDKNRPSVVAIFVTFAIAAALFAVARGQNARKKISSMLTGLILLSVMTTGAYNTVNGKTPQGSAFGFGSPGYFSSAMNNIVSTVASVPAQALNDAATDIDMGRARGSSAQHCNYYIQQLEQEYVAWYSGERSFYYYHPGAPAPPKSGGLQGNAVVPLSLNSMWKTTGLKVFTDAQFGSRNPYGAKVNCRYLDAVSGIPVTDGVATGSDQQVTTIGQKAISQRLGELPWEEKALPWNLTDNERIDNAMVGWAACDVDGDGNVTAVADWTDANERHEIDNNECEQFFTKTEWNGHKSLDFGNDAEKLKDEAPEEIKDFMRNWHGTSNTTAIGIVMLYAVISLVIVITFGILALAVVVSKIGLLMMTLIMIVVVVASIIPTESANNRIAMVFKQYLGMAILAFGASLMISMVAVITRILQSLGATMGGGNIVSIIWSAVSPAVAVFMLHYLFTKVFKAPSPFKPSSGMGFAQAAAGGAVGGAVGGGMIGRQMNRMRYAAERDFMDSLPGRRRGRGGASMRRSGDPATERSRSLPTGSPIDGGAAIGGAASGGGGASTGRRGGPSLRSDADQSTLTGDAYNERLSRINDPTLSDRKRKKLEQQQSNEASDWARAQRRDARATAAKNGMAATGAVVAGAGHKIGNSWAEAKAKTAQTRAMRDKSGKTVTKSVWDGQEGRFHQEPVMQKRNAVARNGETVVRMAGGALRSGASKAGSGAKKAGRTALHAAAHPVKSFTKAAGATAKGARAAGQFAARNRTAITAAALGAATIATGGIAAPLAAGYVAKKAGGAAKRKVFGAERRTSDLAGYQQHLNDQRNAEIVQRNKAAESQAEHEELAARIRAREDEERAKRQDEHDRAQQEMGQEPLPDNQPTLVDEPAPQPKRSNKPLSGDNDNQPGFQF